jgi:hypothetical protein
MSAVTCRMLLRALLGSIVALSGSCVLAQRSDTARVDALQNQLEALQSQMNQLKELQKISDGTTVTNISSSAPPQEPDSKQQVASDLNERAQHKVGAATSNYQTYSEDPAAAPRVDNAPLDPRYPGYFRLPGTKTLLKIGRYFKTDFIRDIRPSGDTDRFITSSIPVPTTGGGTNSTVSVRPTRLSLDFLIPTDTSASARFYLEGDLFGSNATTPRMRHAYAQYKNFLIGQTFSNFQDPDAGPDQLDFQGPNAQVSLRNPQFRYSIPLAKKNSFSAGA